MTARYDGMLYVSAKTKTISACCRAMDEAAMRGQFYVSQKGALMLRKSDKPNGGVPCRCCPFCTAYVMTPSTPVTTLEPVTAVLSGEGSQ